ncbi:hypothetical protein IQ06DRAFT_353817 [Phaeosphaeriaceae sp. SRC1lsM3a]|nr:hypothetical protein IQ06DRAFT_353817 [Stagonospora sp. SRC1lsM3a]
MKFSTLPLAAVFFAASSVSAQSSAVPTSTIKITPGCPSAAPADVKVTRSAVAVPSCAAGNATKPMIVSMSTAGGMGASMTASGMPTQFTGAAEGMRVGGAIGLMVGALAVGLGL